MSESTKKRNKYNEEILDLLNEKYGFGLNYIRKCLRGDRIGIMPNKLIAEYNSLELAAKEAIEETAKQLNQ